MTASATLVAPYAAPDRIAAQAGHSRFTEAPEARARGRLVATLEREAEPTEVLCATLCAHGSILTHRPKIEVLVTQPLIPPRLFPIW